MVARELLDANTSMWHWIASDLYFWRSKQGLTLTQVGQVIGLSKQAVSNLEAGRRRLQDDHAAKLDRAWDLNGHFGRQLLFARRAHDPDWFAQHLHLESRASELRIYELSVIPGLLQTEDYARVVFAAAGTEDLETRVNARLKRQEILQRANPPLLWVLLDEGILDRPVGGPEVMREQLARLLEIGAQPKASIRVVPRGSGFHVGLDGAFKLMRVDRQDVAYTEAAEGGRLAKDPLDVASFTLRYERIGAQALPEGLSREVIRKAMEAFG